MSIAEPASSMSRIPSLISGARRGDTSSIGILLQQ
jgi:hypothetical protein